MNEDKFNLVYGDDTNGRINTALKQIPSKFLTSDIAWGFEVSEGDRPAEPFMPNRYAPIVREVRNVSLFEKGIVIPTGTILSALPVMNNEYYDGASPVTYDGLGVASGDVASGSIGLGLGYDTTLLSSEMDDMIEGYDRIRIVGTIANGGVAAADPYTTFDTGRGRVGTDGTLVTTDDTFARAANIPIGFTTEDIYLFDQGGSLNFSEIKWNRFSSFATDYYVEMPYYAGTYDNATYGDFSDGAAFDSTAATATATYTALKALGMPFYWSGGQDNMLIGSFVQSDMNGKWRAQVNSGWTTATKTAQTVGKLVSFTNKFPGDLEGFVETWNNASATNYGKNYSGATSTGGTATYGLEYRLFVFICTFLTAAEITVSYANIKTAINSGLFGMARVNVHTS